MAKLTPAKKEVKIKKLREDFEELEVGFCTMQLNDRCKNNKGLASISNFYTPSDSNRFYSNGKFSICKNCVKEYCYDKKGNLIVDRFKNILRIYNLPFLERGYETALNSKNDTIGTYIKDVYLNFKDSTWLNSDGVDENPNGIDVCKYQFEVTDEIIRRWGKSYSTEEYEFLEEHYFEWVTNHDAEKLNQKKLICQICCKELDIERARITNQPTDKLEKSLRETMDSASLTPKGGGGERSSAKTWGVFIKDIEQNRPAEYFEDKKIYDDFDKIKEYFNRFILRPMKNLLIGSREFDKEFNVEGHLDD